MATTMYFEKTVKHYCNDDRSMEIEFGTSSWCGEGHQFYLTIDGKSVVMSREAGKKFHDAVVDAGFYLGYDDPAYDHGSKDTVTIPYTVSKSDGSPHENPPSRSIAVSRTREAVDIIQDIINQHHSINTESGSWIIWFGSKKAATYAVSTGFDPHKPYLDMTEVPGETDANDILNNYENIHFQKVAEAKNSNELHWSFYDSEGLTRYASPPREDKPVPNLDCLFGLPPQEN